MVSNQSRVFVVTPVFEDTMACRQLVRELAGEVGTKLCVVAVDDGSVKSPLDPKTLREAGVEGVVLRLRRNVGHQQAIAIGLGYLAESLDPGDRVVVMDADGEDLPSDVPRVLRELEREDIDVVVASRGIRSENWSFKAFYSVYKKFFRTMTGRTISFGNFMALKPRAVRRLVAMQELSTHVAAAVLASRLRILACSLDRGHRYAGESKMNFVGLVLHGFKALMVFAEDVLVRVGLASAGTAVVAVLGALTAVLLKLLGFATPGWFSVALGILFLVFLQTGALALMTLMLTGVVRSGTVSTSISYRDFVEEILETS